MSESAIWLSEEEITSLVSLKDTVVALEDGVRQLGQGAAFNIAKALGSFGEASSMHSLGSAMVTAGFCGYKNWINTPNGAKAVFILFDANEGKLLAVIEANCLGQLRTSAITGLGTKWIARKGANDMAIVGTGRQALAQVAAVHLVRPLERIRIWSPTPEKRRAFCNTLAEQFGVEVLEASTLEEATEGAPIVTTVTRAREPFLKAHMLARGAHLNAVGAILPNSAEFEQDVFARVGFMAVDDVPNARKTSRELIDYFDSGAGAGDWNRVRPLGSVIADNETVPPQCDITLFKSMGMGISDLTVAALAYQRAVQSGSGMPFPLTNKAAIRWNS
ncbi:Delta(1)-pyrroline-2-carboxylate reductase [Paraburkholderia ultramafica]|uniref:Delta(1)-pyrroline-2-carboxylate reductase n=1 Tax=Paraburkholderia ultramafica TaxID=1544867 RepID=A0A6S7D5A6_9BURK|nr:ornithine cyclodeaminase family protein [Paraburkholderia ultramafica]CAB3807045.1 Delta(1)-pyrroline-2-carboxylate reductase [Paraburkholderia ultramafica]